MGKGSKGNTQHSTPIKQNQKAKVTYAFGSRINTENLPAKGQ